MTTNRQLPPETIQINKLAFPAYTKLLSSTNIPVYLVHDDNCKVLKIEFVFDAGSRQQNTPFEAQATNALIAEGTSKLTAKEIAEKLDDYGSYLQNRFGADDSSVLLYCLPKHLERCLSIVYETFTDAIFPESELETLKRNSIQRLNINESKTSYLARRAFYQTVFGTDNCYGSFVNQEVIQNIPRETIGGFYAKHYKNGLKQVLVSGNINSETTNQLLSFCGNFKAASFGNHAVKIEGSNKTLVTVNKANSVQSAIRIGRSFISRSHPDYRRMQFVNLILGGYFGSRLMTNIREEKGLTYGIYSAVESYQDTGAFYVETEINNELRDLGIEEIGKEIEKMMLLPVPSDELETAKNYMLGSFVRSFDGPFSIAERVKILIDFNLTAEYYQEFIEIINAITPLEIQDLSAKYLQKKDLTTIIAG